MRHFKKRTIALILASSISVLGSFALDNYNNTLTNIGFENTLEGDIIVNLETKSILNKPIKVKNVGDKVYEIILPNIYSEVNTPKIPAKMQGYIKDISVNIIPYTKNNIGYTKISFSTYSNNIITAKNTVFLPKQNNNVDKEATSILDDNSSTNDNDVLMNYLLILGVLLIITLVIYFYKRARSNMINVVGENIELDIEDENKSKKETSKTKTTTSLSKKIKTIDSTYQKPIVMPVSNFTQNSSEYVDVEINTENIVDIDELFNSIETNSEENKENQEKNVDSSFNETSQEDDNFMLDDFLSEFEFENENETEDKIEQEIINGQQETKNNEDDLITELFNKYIAQDNLVFTKDDIYKINTLLNNEISEDAIRDLTKKSITNPIKKISKQEILEKLVTEYSIKQNISFTSDDISILHKLISVEIDNDFIKDLRTNSEVQKQIVEMHNSTVEIPHKTSKIMTLAVKDLLPNLSEELSKMNGNKVESNYHPNTVEYNKELDVTTLVLDSALPDLAIEINNESAYISKPSAPYQYVDTNYQVDKLEVENDFLDFDKMLENDDNIKHKENVDANTLLKSIENVTFSSFESSFNEEKEKEKEDDNIFETTDIEESEDNLEQLIDELDKNQDTENNENISNNTENLNNIESTVEIEPTSLETPKDIASDQSKNINVIQEEIDKEFSNNTEELINKIKVTNDTIVEQISEDNSLKQIITDDLTQDNINESEYSNQNILIKEEIKNIQTHAQNVSDKTKNLLLKIRETQNNREERKRLAKIEQENKIKEIMSLQNKNDTFIDLNSKTCVINDEKYEIKDIYSIDQDKGFYLCRNSSGYCVAGYLNKLVVPIKKYKIYSNTTFHVRLTEHSKNNISRYIIKIENHKFVVDVSNNNIQFVVDLC